LSRTPHNTTGDEPDHPRARIDYLEVLPRPGTVTTAATNKSMWGGLY